jgi:hypothetical protein
MHFLACVHGIRTGVQLARACALTRRAACRLACCAQDGAGVRAAPAQRPAEPPACGAALRLASLPGVPARGRVAARAILNNEPETEEDDFIVSRALAEAPPAVAAATSTGSNDEALARRIAAGEFSSTSPFVEFFKPLRKSLAQMGAPGALRARHGRRRAGSGFCLPLFCPACRSAQRARAAPRRAAAAHTRTHTPRACAAPRAGLVCALLTAPTSLAARLPAPVCVCVCARLGRPWRCAGAGAPVARQAAGDARGDG